MLLKSRSHTHHPHMHNSYTDGRHKNMPSISIHLEIFYSYTGGEYKSMLVRFFIVAPGFKDKTRYTLYVSPGSQISHIATNKGNIKDNTYYITY